MPSEPIIQSILVCTGGSVFAEQAIQLAAKLASGLPARLSVLTVQDPADSVDVETIQSQIQKCLVSFRIEADIKLRAGHAAREILAESAAPYDLTILGSHGTKGIIEFFLGDTAVQVIGHLKRSTLIVRPDGEIRNILACVRLGRERRDVVALGASIARATGSWLTILYVLPLPTMYGMHVRDNLQLMERHPAEAGALTTLADDIASTSGTHPHVRLRQGIPEEEILEEIQEAGHNLVIVGSSSWRGVSGMLLGNISHTIVKHANTSVLVAMAPEER